jgi:hypothetical protein
MGLADENVVDFAGEDENAIVLVIFDSFEWNSFDLEDYIDDDYHMELLGAKMSTCIEFYKGGQIYEQFPAAKHKPVIIRVMGLHELNERAEWFYEASTKGLEEHGMGLEFELSEDEDSVEDRRKFDERVKALTGD